MNPTDHYYSLTSSSWEYLTGEEQTTQNRRLIDLFVSRSTLTNVVSYVYTARNVVSSTT